MRKVFLFTAVLMAIIITGCSSDDDVAGGSGLLETDEVIVSAETSGRVIELRFAEGDRIQAGDTIVVIDPSRVELELASARAGRKVAQANLETARLQVQQATTSQQYTDAELQRVTRLLNSSTATQKQYDAVKFEYDRAVIALKTAHAGVTTIEAELTRIDADIARLERQSHDAYPTAPMTGTVIEKLVDPGELLSPGRPIVRLARMDTMWVKVYLPAGRFANITLGSAATVSTESGGKTFKGTVVWTSGEAEFTPKNVQTEQSRADLVYAVKVRIANADGTLKIGMPVFVTLEM